MASPSSKMATPAAGNDVVIGNNAEGSDDWRRQMTSEAAEGKGKKGKGRRGAKGKKRERGREREKSLHANSFSSFSFFVQAKIPNSPLLLPSPPNNLLAD